MMKKHGGAPARAAVTSARTRRSSRSIYPMTWRVLPNGCGNHRPTNRRRKEPPLLLQPVSSALAGTSPARGEPPLGGSPPRCAWAALRSVSEKDPLPLNDGSLARGQDSERERRAAVVEDLRLSNGDVGRPHAGGHVARTPGSD